MQKRMTLVVILDDKADPNLKNLDSMTNEEWAEEMRKVYGEDPSVHLESVKVEDMS